MRKVLFGFALAGVVLVAAGDAKADEAADIQYRQNTYKAIGAHMKNLVAILKQQVPHAKDAAVHANGIKALSTVVPHVFPEGSDFGETEAKAEIWEKPDDFKKAVMAFQGAADDLAKAAAVGDMGAIGAGVGALGKTCKGCHDNFREKK